MSASIKDVAKLAGVSVATVSRALSGGTVSAALRVRVEEAAAACGYRPNLSARRLRSQHSRTVGLIVSDIRNPFFTAVSRAVEDVAYQAGMRVILCNTDEDPAKEAMYLRLMQEERVGGVILAATREGGTTQTLAGLGFPVVLIDRAGDGGCDAVQLDNHGASGMLVRHLLEQGYRRIGGLFGNTSTTGAERCAGFLAAMRAAGLEGEARFVAPSQEAAQAELGGWLASGRAPEALLASNGLLLLGALRAVRAAGMRLPDDLALAGFDNDSWTELAGPGLTVIEQPVLDIGQSAMQMLLERLRQPERPARKVVLSGRLVARASSLRGGSA